MTESLRNKSRRDWLNDSNGSEQIQLGCLLRIADATEAMAKQYTDLINERDWLSGAYKRRGDRINRLERSLAAHKGQITKLRKKLTQVSASGEDIHD